MTGVYSIYASLCVFLMMRQSGRRIHVSEFGSCKSPAGQCIRQVFPLNHSSQFWVSESGIAFQRTRVNGVFQWANRGEPVKLPLRVSSIWAIALAWTEPPAVDAQFPLRPIRLSPSEPLSPSSIAWTRCSSHRSVPSGDLARDLATDGLTDGGGVCVQWTPLLALPSYVHTDGHIDCTKLAAGEYHVTRSGILRTRHNLTYEPLRTHLKGRPYRLALPEGSAFVRDICVACPSGHADRRTTRHDTVYNCIVSAGRVDTTCIRNSIGSMGNEQTIHSAVFQCIKVRPVREIDMVFIEATTSPRVRAVCLDMMRRDPDVKSAAVVSQLCTDQPPWQLYAEVRMARELIRKFEFDPPVGW